MKGTTAKYAAKYTEEMTGFGVMKAASITFKSDSIFRLMVNIGMCVLLLMALSACSEARLASHAFKKMVGTEKPKQFKVGKPYRISGVTYTPRIDMDYDKRGIASWYGPNFHGKYTANGEVYNKYDYTAAHPTLPLPTIVRVTNLDNGKTVDVRINDRGPFVDNRIIDLSYAAARRIEMHKKGLANVRVRVLQDKTLALYQRVPKAPSYAELFPGKKTYNVVNNTAKSEPVKMQPLQPVVAPVTTPVKVASTEPPTNIYGDTVYIPTPASGRLPDRLTEPMPDYVTEDPVSLPPIKAATPVIPSTMSEVIASAEIERSVPSEPVNIISVENLSADNPFNKGYFIQAGAFTSALNAQNMKAQLAAQIETHKLRVNEANLNGQPLYKVQIGPFSNPDDARQKANGLTVLSANSYTVVSDNK